MIGLIAVQTLCAAFFLWDVVADMRPGGMSALTNLHILTEAMAALALVSAIAVELRYLIRLLLGGRPSWKTRSPSPQAPSTISCSRISIAGA